MAPNSDPPQDASSSSPHPKSPRRLVQDEAARCKDVAVLVASVEGTIKTVAKPYSFGLSDEDVEDLHAAGREGAVEAALRYDLAHESAASFNSYAIFRIRAHVRDEAFALWSRDRCRLGKGTRRIFSRLGWAWKEAWGDASAVAAALGVDASLLSAVLAASSVDAVYDGRAGSDEEFPALADVLADEDAEDAEASICARSEAEELRAALDVLDDRERLVIKRRYFDGASANEVGVEIGRGGARVRQIEAEALRKLRAEFS